MAETYKQLVKRGWTCFFCGETFRQPETAREHFGATQFATAACRIKAGEEHGLVVALRKAEAELERYHDEDSDADRAMSKLRSDHTLELRRQEELGYARGLKDGMAVKP
ncbi:MAG TPA: hypothetical protein VF928_12725 [Usitatibacteraceae bacterium]